MSDQDLTIVEQNGRREAISRSHFSGRGECSCFRIVKLGAGQRTSECACTNSTTKAPGNQDLTLGEKDGRVFVPASAHVACRGEASRRRVVQFGAGKTPS